MDDASDFEDMESRLQEAVRLDCERKLNDFCEKLTELRALFGRVDYRHDRSEDNVFVRAIKKRMGTHTEEIEMKIEEILERLKSWTMRDEATDPDGFWNDLEIAGDNAVDHFIDRDKALKQLIADIEDGS